MVTGMSPTSPLHSHQHAVQFYGDEAELFKTIGSFLIEGLVALQPAIIIATAPHTQAVLDELAGRHIDVANARKIGDLVILDAEETLATFMSDGSPDPDLFRRNVGGVIEQAIRGRERTPVRAYGEMVDVLWKKEQSEAAIKLEVLWNELANQYSFSLLCGYAIGNFYKQTSNLEEVVAQHTHVIGTTGSIPSNVVSFADARAAFAK
jgi:hypothetical protein